MVNTTIVSRHSGELPLNEGASRKISGGPLYPAEEVRELLANSGDQAIRAWTNKCNEDMQKWTLNADDLLELIEIGLRIGRFRGSEWCVQQPNGPWAACDVYLVKRREMMPNAPVEMDTEYYIKFAVSKTRVVLLVVSCHPPEERRW